ncbi:MAG: hypothetical protein ACO1RT_00900 [Planctomycetaceae bacterium]
MTRYLLLASAFITLAVSAQIVAADPPVTTTTDDYGWAEFRLSDEPSPSISVESTHTPRPAATSVSRLRQQRAAYQQSQRLARMEANAWFGHDPLRPGWSTVPMMSSRYTDRRTIVIPVYVP